jgi:hypothetical protein
MTNHKLKFFASVFAVFLSTFIFAQSQYEGEALINFIGKDSGSSEVKNLENGYHCNMINENHYLSIQGIELMLNNGVLTEINLYKSNTAYGNFTGKLPRGMAFGMSSSQVRSLLGKPTVAYASGYSEFDMHNCVIACWFDGDRLSQVGISSSSAR